MATADPISPEPHRFSIRVARPIWIRLGAAMLIIVVVGLQIGVPIYRQHVAIREIQPLGGVVKSVHGGLAWLRQLVGDEHMAPFDLPYSLSLADTEVTDEDLGRFLPAIESRSSLQTLSLANTQVTDAGLSHLARLAAACGRLTDGPGPARASCAIVVRRSSR